MAASRRSILLQSGIFPKPFKMVELKQNIALQGEAYARFTDATSCASSDIYSFLLLHENLMRINVYIYVSPSACTKFPDYVACGACGCVRRVTGGP
jgi:hypothetical protein